MSIEKLLIRVCLKKKKKEKKNWCCVFAPPDLWNGQIQPHKSFLALLGFWLGEYDYNSQNAPDKGVGMALCPGRWHVRSTGSPVTFVREAAGDITGFQLIGFMLPGNKQNKEHMTAASQ